MALGTVSDQVLCQKPDIFFSIAELLWGSEYWAIILRESFRRWGSLCCIAWNSRLRPRKVSTRDHSSGIGHTSAVPAGGLIIKNPEHGYHANHSENAAGELHVPIAYTHVAWTIEYL